MEEIERPGTPGQPDLGVASSIQQYELDKLQIRKTLDAFNAYTFAMKGIVDGLDGPSFDLSPLNFGSNEPVVMISVAVVQGTRLLIGTGIALVSGRSVLFQRHPTIPGTGQKLMSSRNTLAKALADIYTGESNPFMKHALALSQHLDPSQGSEKVESISKLKVVGSECRKQYDERFEMLDKVVAFAQSFPARSKRHQRVMDQMVEELTGFSQQRLDVLDSLLVQALDSEHKMGLAFQLDSKSLSLIAEAKNLHEACQENFSPKMHMSLKHLLSNPNSTEYLKSFFRKRQMVEGLQFWLEVQKFKQLDDPLVEAGARFIYNLYIADDGDRAVNLASEDSDPIHRAIKSPHRNMFDSAAKSIATLLEDNLDGFHSSIYYQQMMSHLKPLRSFQEFVADVGGPAASKNTSNSSSSRKSQLPPTATAAGSAASIISARSSANSSPNPNASSRESPSGTLNDSTPENITEEVALLADTLDVAATLKLPDLTITSMCPTQTEILCGCLDGSIISVRYDKDGASVESSEVVPPGLVEGKILSIQPHTAEECLILTDRGRVSLFDVWKQKLVLKLAKGEPAATGLLRVDRMHIWISFGKTIQDWQWNSKKKKFAPAMQRAFSRPVTTMVRVENTIWVGDDGGGITRLQIFNLHPLGERFRVSQSPVHVIHASQYSTKLRDFTSTTTRIWVTCRDSTLHVFDSDGSLVKKQDAFIHDLPIVGAVTLDKCVILGSEDGSLSVWQADALEFVERIGRIHKDSISAICSQPEQQLIYTAGLDRLLATWRYKTTRKPLPPPIMIGKKQSRSAGRKSMLEPSFTPSPTPESPKHDEDSTQIHSPSPTSTGPMNSARSFNVSVDALLQISKHPEQAGSLTSRGLGSSPAADDTDLDYPRPSSRQSTDSFPGGSSLDNPRGGLLKSIPSARSNASSSSPPTD